MKDPVVVLPYNDSWPAEFKIVGERIRQALGDAAIRIDHVGSTSVVGIDAKPIIDIQISVKRLESLETYKPQLESVGFIHREDNPDKSKAYFRERPGTKRTHIHVREHGSWSEQLTLLFRDYLRAHPEACTAYVKEKHHLMELHRNEREKYADGKTPIIWSILQQAHFWSQETGWKPGNSDM